MATHLKLLVDHPELDLNVRTTDGNTTLHCASNVRNTTCCDILMQHANKLDVNTRNNSGQTALRLAVRNMCTSTLLVDLLLRRDDLDVNITDHDGETPLMLAQQLENETPLWVRVDR